MLKTGTNESFIYYHAVIILWYTMRNGDHVKRVDLSTYKRSNAYVEALKARADEYKVNMDRLCKRSRYLDSTIEVLGIDISRAIRTPNDFYDKKAPKCLVLPPVDKRLILQMEERLKNLKEKRSNIQEDISLTETELEKIRRELDDLVPELTAAMSYGKLVDGVHTPVELIVSNKGHGPAYGVKCKVHGHIKGETSVHFGMIEDVPLQKIISLKPTEKGKMRWDLEVSYSDAVGRSYRIGNEYWMDVEAFLQPTTVVGTQVTQVIGEVHGDVVGNKVSENIHIQDSVISGSDIGTKISKGNGDKEQSLENIINNLQKSKK